LEASERETRNVVFGSQSRRFERAPIPSVLPPRTVWMWALDAIVRELLPVTLLPLLARPRAARKMLGDCSTERLYQLLNSGQLESFRDGRARLITIRSIHGYIARRLVEAGAPPASTPATTPPRRRGAVS
jgi:hypothetical protein